MDGHYADDVHGWLVFENDMLEAADVKDTEVRHRLMDEVMCRALQRLGYTAGVKVFSCL